MKAKTKKILIDAIKYCDEHDKSTEFMIQYMQDVSGCSFDTIINFLEKYQEDENSNAASY